MKKRKREEDTQAQRTEPVLAAVREQRDQFSGRLELYKPTWAAGERRGGKTAGENGEEGEATGFSHSPVPPSSLVPHSPAPTPGNSLSQQASGLRRHSPENRSV